MPRLIVCVPTATALVVGCLAMPHPSSGGAYGRGYGDRWNLLSTVPVGTGVTRKPTQFQLKLGVGVTAGAGSARFAHFQQCP